VTIDECFELVRATEETGLTYMLAENYCYMRPNMMVLNMASGGCSATWSTAKGRTSTTAGH